MEAEVDQEEDAVEEAHREGEAQAVGV
jgi:hypothetical protein